MHFYSNHTNLLNIKCICNNVESTSVLIEDCYKYDKCDVDKTSDYTLHRGLGGNATLSFDTDHYNYIIPYPNGAYSIMGLLPLTSSSKYEITFLSYSTRQSSSTTQYNLEMVGFGAYNNADWNSIVSDVHNNDSLAPAIRFGRYINNSYVESEDIFGADYNQTWLKHKITINGLSFSYTVELASTGATIKTYSNTFSSEMLNGTFGIFGGTNNSIHYIKEIKVKSL